MSLLQSAAYIREMYAIPLTIEEIMDGINRTVEDFYFYTVLPKEGVISFLEQMKVQGIKMCIATDHYQVEMALKRYGMNTLLSEIFTRTDVEHGKDEPIIFQKAMEHLQTTKADTVVFEDDYHAARTAKADGFITIAVYDCMRTYRRSFVPFRTVSLRTLHRQMYFGSLLTAYKPQASSGTLGAPPYTAMQNDAEK